MRLNHLLLAMTSAVTSPRLCIYRLLAFYPYYCILRCFLTQNMRRTYFSPSHPTSIRPGSYEN
ncbi:hypothetical protein Mapa_002023 [Marchantia paleacea]|nr:hypothetical protein Mapa_002023 [Marchantia paleacea]